MKSFCYQLKALRECVALSKGRHNSEQLSRELQNYLLAHAAEIEAVVRIAGELCEVEQWVSAQKLIESGISVKLGPGNRLVDALAAINKETP